MISIQPELKLKPRLSTLALLRIFRKSSHHVNTNNSSVVKQSADDVEGCLSQKVLFQPNMRAFLQYSVMISRIVSKGFVSTQHARISTIQCKMYRRSRLIMVKPLFRYLPGSQLTSYNFHEVQCQKQENTFVKEEELWSGWSLLSVERCLEAYSLFKIKLLVVLCLLSLSCGNKL